MGIYCQYYIAWAGGKQRIGGHFCCIYGSNQFLSLCCLMLYLLFTHSGGMYSVVWTDFLWNYRSSICLYYGYALAPVNFSMTVLQQRLAEVGAAELGTISTPLAPFKNFITGCFCLGVQIYWQMFCSQRCCNCPSGYAYGWCWVGFS